MEKKQIKTLAAMGLLSGLLAASSYAAEASSTSSQGNASNYEDYDLMTEDEVLAELNEDGKKLYQSLDAQGKELARKVASQRCFGNNECSGLNACKTDKNSCAGQGNCKGQSKCAFEDKNLAIKTVYNKEMAGKRNRLSN